MKNVLYEIFFATFISHLARCWVLCFFPKKISFSSSLYPSHKTLKSEKIYIMCVYITHLYVYIFATFVCSPSRKKRGKFYTAKRESTFLLRASKASFSHYYLNSFFIIIKYVWSFFHIQICEQNERNIGGNLLLKFLNYLLKSFFLKK